MPVDGDVVLRQVIPLDHSLDVQRTPSLMLPAPTLFRGLADRYPVGKVIVFLPVERQCLPLALITVAHKQTAAVDFKRHIERHLVPSIVELGNILPVERFSIKVIGYEHIVVLTCKFIPDSNSQRCYGRP